MRVAYFPKSCAQNSSAVMNAVLEALRQRGHTPVQDDMTADAAVIWSVLWSGRLQPNLHVWQHFTSKNKPVIVIDIGSLYRGHTWKVALNSITARGYYGHQENLDWDRPRKLGISLALNLSRNPRIVIAAQHARSLQVAELVSIESWIKKQIETLTAISDRPITVRPHPRCSLDRNKLGIMPDHVSFEQPRPLIDTYDSYNLAFDCHAMINYNSGPGIQAALAGTRPIVDQTSLAYPVGIDFDQLEQPYQVDRDRWLVEICHTEYKLEEIAQGSWIKRLNI